MKNCPKSASASAPIWVHFLILLEYKAPDKTPQSTSTIAPSPYPLNPEVNSLPPRGAKHPLVNPRSFNILINKLEVEKI